MGPRRRVCRTFGAPAQWQPLVHPLALRRTFRLVSGAQKIERISPKSGNIAIMIMVTDAPKASSVTGSR